MKLTITDALAIYRLTRVVNEDSQDFPPLRGARAVLAEVLPDDWSRLLDCPWCASAWVGLGALAARRIAPRAWRGLAWVMAGSAVAGLLRQAEGALHSADLAGSVYIARHEPWSARNAAAEDK